MVWKNGWKSLKVIDLPGVSRLSNSFRMLKILSAWWSIRDQRWVPRLRRRVHRCQWISRSPFFRKILDLPRSQQVCLKAHRYSQKKSLSTFGELWESLEPVKLRYTRPSWRSNYLLVSRQNRSKKQCRRKLYRRFHRWDEKAFWWWIGPCARN